MINVVDKKMILNWLWLCLLEPAQVAERCLYRNQAWNLVAQSPALPRLPCVRKLGMGRPSPIITSKSPRHVPIHSQMHVSTAAAFLASNLDPWMSKDQHSFVIRAVIGLYRIDLPHL